MSLYTNAVQRNRYNLYLYSANGAQLATATGFNPSQTTYTLRKSGFIYKPELYQGCIVGVNSFRSNAVPDVVLQNMYQGGGPTGPPVNQFGQGSSVHVVLAQGGQSNGAFNLNRGVGGIAQGLDISQYNTPNILCSSGWNPMAVTTAGNNLVADLEYSCQGGDPVSNGIFIPSPFDEMTISLRFNDWTLVDGEGASLDDAGNAIDLDYFLHLVVQPVLKSYEVPVAERLIL